uniref:Uncharacterized protein n=1 Tax=Chromera velia CCMP2878 TaxID=1169474 RepID=A0A0G4HYI5_9ALVE|eukprot:Cvel_9498.t1-p1 / transcript=Cvel_9498.t1 / gene=Cvel_9498 / organism=Chromera_velia_CCMP2878 / gene_product=hypothetical protein / transcript_product=hypothetical protein / location=Cvel_scaffold549:14337-20352(-) / protein_length=1128 / sequence_SO=supercontig / SO=protein_coding / is_pseudo=false
MLLPRSVLYERRLAGPRGDLALSCCCHLLSGTRSVAVVPSRSPEGASSELNRAAVPEGVSVSAASPSPLIPEPSDRAEGRVRSKFHVSTALNLLAKQKSSNKSAWEALLRRAVEGEAHHHASLKDCCLVLNACARSPPTVQREKESKDSLFRETVEVYSSRALKKLRRSKPLHLAILANSWARLGLHTPDRFHLIAKHLAPPRNKMSRCDGRMVANILNAYARAGVRDASLLSLAAAPRLEEIAGRMSSKHVVQVVNALAKLEYRHETVFLQMASRLCEDPVGAHLDGTCTGLVAHAYAKMGIFDDSLFQRLARRSLLVLQNSDMRALCNLLFAFTRLEAFRERQKESEWKKKKDQGGRGSRDRVRGGDGERPRMAPLIEALLEETARAARGERQTPVGSSLSPSTVSLLLSSLDVYLRIGRGEGWRDSMHWKKVRKEATVLLEWTLEPLGEGKFSVKETAMVAGAAAQLRACDFGLMGQGGSLGILEISGDEEEELGARGKDVGDGLFEVWRAIGDAAAVHVEALVCKRERQRGSRNEKGRVVVDDLRGTKSSRKSGEEEVGDTEEENESMWKDVGGKWYRRRHTAGSSNSFSGGVKNSSFNILELGREEGGEENEENEALDSLEDDLASSSFGESAEGYRAMGGPEILHLFISMGIGRIVHVRLLSALDKLLGQRHLLEVDANTDPVGEEKRVSDVSQRFLSEEHSSPSLPVLPSPSVARSLDPSGNGGDLLRGVGAGGVLAALRGVRAIARGDQRSIRVTGWAWGGIVEALEAALVQSSWELPSSDLGEALFLLWEMGSRPHPGLARALGERLGTSGRGGEGRKDSLREKRKESQITSAPPSSFRSEWVRFAKDLQGDAEELGLQLPQGGVSTSIDTLTRNSSAPSSLSGLRVLVALCAPPDSSRSVEQKPSGLGDHCTRQRAESRLPPEDVRELLGGSEDPLRGLFGVVREELGCVFAELPSEEHPESDRRESQLTETVELLQTLTDALSLPHQGKQEAQMNAESGQEDSEDSSSLLSSLRASVSRAWRDAGSPSCKGALTLCRVAGTLPMPEGGENSTEGFKKEDQLEKNPTGRLDKTKKGKEMFDGAGGSVAFRPTVLSPFRLRQKMRVLGNNMGPTVSKKR